MKICGGVVAIKKLAFANSYRTVVDQKPQVPPVFRSGNTCANCGVPSGKCFLSKWCHLCLCTSVHLADRCKHHGDKQKYLSVYPPTLGKTFPRGTYNVAARNNIYPSDPKHATFSKGVSPP